MHETLHESWFNRLSEPVATDETPDERSSTLPAARLAGDPLWSAVSGAMAGGVASILLLVLMFHVDVLVRPYAATIALLAGALVGAVFGRLTRRLVRVFPRVLVVAILAAACWLLAYAFVLLRFLPHLTRSIPLASSMLAAVTYGACIGMLRPLRVRYEHGRRP